MPPDLTEIARAALEVLPPEARSAGSRERLRQFLAALVEANRGINLVSRRDTVLHVTRFTLECAWLARLLLEDENRLGPSRAPRLLDLGTGGGFPGLVLKLLLPHVLVTLVEGTRKKAHFLGQTSRALDLSGITVIWARAELLSDRRLPSYRSELRHHFDWVTAKAVGALRDSLRLASPFMAPEGLHWTFKGKGWELELRACRPTLRQMAMQVQRVEPIPGEASSVIVAIGRRPLKPP